MSGVNAGTSEQSSASVVDPVELVQWREAIDAVMPFSTLPTLGQLEQLLRWLFGDALSWANIVQVPALLLTGGVAWLLCHPVRARITAWIDRHPDRHHLDWLVQHRPLATKRLVPLITPAVWAIGLWISVSVAEYGGWPHAVAQVAVNLLLAWLVIRLAAEMVPNPVLARLHRGALLVGGCAQHHTPSRTHTGVARQRRDRRGRAARFPTYRHQRRAVADGSSLGGVAVVQAVRAPHHQGLRRLRRGRGFCSESCSRPPWSASPSFCRWPASA